jgi:fumarylacetoacetate (FAA) hydrolase
MKLASLRAGLDGELVLVSRDLTHMVRVSDIAATMQDALDNWAGVRPLLAARYQGLVEGTGSGVEPFNCAQVASPLPRAYQWCDGSVFAAHNDRMSKWINKPVDPRFYQEPWMYQGASDTFLAPTDSIPGVSEDWGIDYEAEVAVVTDAVPYGVTQKDAEAHVALVMLVNDISLRNLIPAELSKGFGFVQSKPASAFSPVAVTPDELGTAWRDCRVHLRLRSFVNGALFGDPDAGEMVHGFDRLVSHVAKTRAIGPGSIIGSGTVASADPARGTSCIVERRVVESLAHGNPSTPFLRFGDRVKLEMLDHNGQSIFGSIDQSVVRVEAGHIAGTPAA